MFNRKTEHIWTLENLWINRPIRAQVLFSLHVWAGIYGDRIIGLFFDEQTLDEAGYLEFLTIKFTQYVDEPPHNTRNVRGFLHQKFPGKWNDNRE